MIRRPPRSTLDRSSAASDVYKGQAQARLKEHDGDLDAAFRLLDEAKRLYVRSLIPYTRPIEALKARIYLKQERLSKAREWAREQGLSVDDELSYLSLIHISEPTRPY